MNDMDLFYSPCMGCKHCVFDDIRLIFYCCVYNCKDDDVECCESYEDEEDEP